MAYGNFKDLAIRTAADKFLRDEAFNIVKDPKYDGYQRGLAFMVGYQRGLSFMVYKFFDKKTTGSGIKSMSQNEQSAKELHKPIIKNF